LEEATESQFIDKKQDGVVAFDVTADVQAFLDGADNFGWVIRKGEENKAGYVTFHSRETGATGPRLVLTYIPAYFNGSGEDYEEDGSESGVGEGDYEEVGAESADDEGEEDVEE
jgi:hypothetical protein